MEKNEIQKGLVLDVNENPKKVSQWILFALQHILAMFVACITVPLLTGLPIDATIVSAGIGTLFYIFVTKKKSPVVLSSSFAYIAPIVSALSLGEPIASGQLNYMALIIGMAIVGIIYVSVALIIRACGTSWIDKLLPPIIVGPVIMVIGLGLSVSAINNLTGQAVGDYSIVKVACGLVAMVVTAISAHYGKKMIKMIPFVIGMGSGYLLALILTFIGKGTGNVALQIIDFSPLIENFKNISFESFVKIPDFIFLQDMSRFEWKQIPQIVLLFAPTALVTICEHLGDHLNLSNIIGRDLTKDPGLTRTLIGDGVATSISGVLSGCANTTYGENVAVVGITKVASVNVIILACILTIALGFLRPFMCFAETIPACVTGGVSLILYGFIASSGVKMLIQERIDFGNTKNIFIASAILVAGIGGLVLNFGNLTITSTAVGMILGIVLNLILVDKKGTKKDKYIPLEEQQKLNSEE